MVKSEEETYDVSKYTEKELFDILDLTGSPTDRELEAKILFLIRKYDTIQNDSGKRLAKFFRDIFDHFFDDPDNDEGDENINSEQKRETTDHTGLNDTIQVFETMTADGASTTLQPVPVSTSTTLSKQATTITSAPPDLSSQLDTIAKSLKIKSNEDKQSNVNLTRSLDYSKDVLNPLLKQTIKRIISIDSQYREDHKTLSTDFTFNLSDPLKDVVSLKLYSIQIPYTWWTINANFGSNFIYIKGSSPGINISDFDLLITIEAGNYSPDGLVTAVNNSLQTALLTQTDTNFGTTKIKYNPNNSLCTFTVDIKKTYSESSYYLYFPFWTTPSETTHMSIPSFLGYSAVKYYPFVINSAAVLDLTTSPLTDSDTKNAIYYLDNTNNYFNIITYHGNDVYSPTESVIKETYKVSLSISGITTRTLLVNDLSNQLATSPFLQESYIKRIDITDTTMTTVGHSYYFLAIKVNRNTTTPTNNERYVVIFPDETAVQTDTIHRTVWTGTTSCFCFETNINQPNDIVSEMPAVTEQVDKIIFKLPLSIQLTCNKLNFINPINNYTITVPTSNQGYTYTDIINALNTSFATTNNYSKIARSLGDFNMTYTNAYINPNHQITMQFDLNRVFNQDLYVVDLSQSFLHLNMNLSQSYLDLSFTNVFQSSFNLSNGYKIKGTSLLVVSPSNLNGGNNQEPPYYVPIPTIPNVYTDSNGFYTSYQNLQNAINQQFSVFVNDGQRTLQGTSVTLTYNSNTQRIDTKFKVVVQRVLNQDNYNIQLIDPSASLLSNDTIDPNTSVWSKQLLFDSKYLSSYPLTTVAVTGQPFSRISGSPIFFNVINISNTNNSFYLKAFEKGVVSKKHENDILIKIPNGTYNRTGVINAINNQLNTIALTNGSYMKIINVNNIEYTSFHMIINKIYTAKDYSLVFYDPFSFVKCFSGVSSVRNTTWDATLGWTLGFRTTTTYGMSESNTDNNTKVDDKTNIVTINGDTTVSTNLYNYFLICIDDYNMNYLNDGLVTITTKEKDISLPSYANRSNYVCDPLTGTKVYNNTVDTTTYNSLTQKQLYTLNAINQNMNSKRSQSSVVSGTGESILRSISSGPFVKDVFGIIPMKTSGLANGSVYVDFSGTLQNQERTYFGPVNIQRMSVKLVTDRGDVINLNGSNWSFSLLCEQLYQQKPTNPDGKKNGGGGE